MRVLITGGAGFIGSHLADRLLAEGHTVRVLDDLDPQVHTGAAWPAYLSGDAELRPGRRPRPRRLRARARRRGLGRPLRRRGRRRAVDVRDRALRLDQLDRLRRAARGAASSAATRSGSCSSPRRCRSTARASTAPCDRRDRPRAGAAPGGAARARASGSCSAPDGTPLVPEPTSETKRLRPTSVYAVTKRDHEELCLAVGAAYGIPTVALRFFNVYGARQALSNPYTGVAAIFASRLLNGRPPLVFEDGLPDRATSSTSATSRAAACSRCEPPGADGEAVNLGTGVPTSVLDVAEVLARGLGKDDRARDARPVPGGRHPPLLRRPEPRPRAARLRDRDRLRGRHARPARMARGPGGRPTAWTPPTRRSPSAASHAERGRSRRLRLHRQHLEP